MTTTLSARVSLLLGSLIVSAAAITVPAHAATTYSQTKYPVVLVHGMSGFGNIGPVNYFYGVASDLSNNGAKVYTPVVSGFQSSEYRGEQLLTQVNSILALSGAKKVNLIGHSHGSHTIRYVNGMIPAKIASVTTVGGPNKGSAVADLITSAASLPVVGSPVAGLLSSVVNGFGQLIGLGQGQALSQDSLVALASLSTAGSAAFTKKFPAGMPTTSCGEGAYSQNGTLYYSWSGTSNLTNILDPLDGGLALTGLAFLGADNDGLVERCSSHFGKVLRDNYAQNHLDEVNQILGAVGLFQDPVSLYRIHANRLKVAGQ